jgi:hypothetical protein
MAAKTSTLLRIAAAATLCTLSLVGSAAGGGPGLSPGTGCAMQCIKKALVRATASSATVELETTVLAHLKVSVREQGAPSGGGGGIALDQTRVVSISAFNQSKVAKFFNLEPDTTYAITVQATDLNGYKASRKGTFKTLPVKTTGHGGAGSIDSGLGCAAQCIQQAWFSQTKPAGTIANAKFKTTTDARIRMLVARDSARREVVSDQLSPGLVRSWQTQVGGLDYGRRYYVSIHATDAQGRTAVRKGTFNTVPASVLVTVHKIKVLNDGDKWGKGELIFRYFVDGKERADSGFHKIDSGSVVDARVTGTSRPGVVFRYPANGNAKFNLVVYGEECDAVLMKNCVVEYGAPSGQYAGAGGTFDVSSILAGGALPGWAGTGVQPPPGHDAYVVFGTTDKYVKFLVLATVDLDVDWP